MKVKLTNPALDEGLRRVYCGGSWLKVAGGTRVSYRYDSLPSYSNLGRGFRLVRNR